MDEKIISLFEIFSKRKTINLLFLISVITTVIAIFLGMHYGWVNFQLTHALINTSPPFLFHITPISIFSYGIVGAAVTLLLLSKDFLERLSSSAKENIIFLLLVPESIILYELIWFFAFWLKNDLIQNIFFVAGTKLLNALLFMLIAVQLILILKKSQKNEI